MNQPLTNPQTADPLAQLKDIHLPEPIGWWPPAPGWWLITLLAVISIALLVRWLYQHHRSNRYRRHALRSLEQCFRLHGDSPTLITELLTLLRRVVLTTAPESSHTALSKSADAFLLHLNQWVKQPLFDPQIAQQLAQISYLPHPQPLPQQQRETLHHACKQWLKQHSRKQLRSHIGTEK